MIELSSLWLRSALMIDLSHLDMTDEPLSEMAALRPSTVSRSFTVCSAIPPEAPEDDPLWYLRLTVRYRDDTGRHFWVVRGGANARFKVWALMPLTRN